MLFRERLSVVIHLLKQWDLAVNEFVADTVCMIMSTTGDVFGLMNIICHCQEDVRDKAEWPLNPQISACYLLICSELCNILQKHTEQLTVCASHFTVLFVCVSGVILHEEHIELLSEEFKVLKREVEGKILQEGTLHFTGKRQDCVSLMWLLLLSFKPNLLMSCSVF